MSQHHHRVAVVLASAGRPALLAEVLGDVARQSFQDFLLVVSVPDDASLPSGGLPVGTLVARASGLASQRNAGLDLVPDATHVFCFDDDAVIRFDYLQQALSFFDAHPDVVAMTGRVLADGATGEAIERATAESELSASLTTEAGRPSAGWRPSREMYGCNFAFRPPAVGGQRFDGRLPLYSWLEDHDFCRRAMRYGVVAKVDACVIVHRGVKSGGRVAHRRLGYAQAMNPAYLWHVGSFPLWLALSEASKRIVKNAIFSVHPTQGAWRRARLRGNSLAGADIIRGRFAPERMLDLPPG